MNDRTTTMVALVLAVFALTAYIVYADPTGASILTNESAGQPTSSPDSRADSRGTITTLRLDTVQQDQFWKAYVGNVTGSLSLDNADGFTIYDWSLSGSVAGEVYVSRAGSPDFTNLSCINNTILDQEHTFYDMTASAVDSINNTYNYTNHQAIVIGGFGTISADSCRSTATYVNDTAQSIDGNQTFQAVILQDDTNSNAIFVTIIDDNTYGYDNNISFNKTYDFQIIVPESDTNTTPTTYYFWTELDG